MRGFKVLTHDLRPPVQGGNPVFDGSLPCDLLPVILDTSESDCKAGWNFCAKASTALSIAGIWSNGRPSLLFECEGGSDTIKRGEKLRSSTCRLLRKCEDDEVHTAIREMSKSSGDLTNEITEQQWQWRAALERPSRSREMVQTGLREALAARGLDWTIREFPTAESLRNAWEVKQSWSISSTLRLRETTRCAWGTRAGSDSIAAWYTCYTGMLWYAWGTRGGGDARDALVVWYAGSRKLIDCDPMLLTTGLRDAYYHGLAIAIPTGPQELGWVMDSVL